MGFTECYNRLLKYRLLQLYRIHIMHYIKSALIEFLDGVATTQDKMAQFSNQTFFYFKPNRKLNIISTFQN